METVVATITGYHGSDRFNLIKLIDLSGANFVGYLNNTITHLVCWRFEGKKYELAKKLKVKVVNHRWIEACIKNKKRVPEDLYTDKWYSQQTFVMTFTHLLRDFGEEVGTLSLDISQFAEKRSSQDYSIYRSKKHSIDIDYEDSAPSRWTNSTLSNENEEPDFTLLPRERRKNTELGESSHRRHMLVKNNVKKNCSSSSWNPNGKLSRRIIIDELSDGTTVSDGPSSDLLENPINSDFTLLPRERRKNTESSESSHRRHMLVKNNVRKNGSSSSRNPNNKFSRRIIIDELSDGTTASDGPSSDVLANPKKRSVPLGEREIYRGGRRLVKKNASADKPIFILDSEQEHNHALILSECSDGTAIHSSAINHDKGVGARQVREILEEIPEVTDVTNTVSHENQHAALSNSSSLGRELQDEWSLPNGCSNEIEQGAQSSKVPEISCVICLAEFNLVRGLLLCGHRFCFQCIYDWARACLEKRKPPRCPLCKASFETINKYTHTEDNLDQKAYTQTSLSEDFGTDVSVYVDNQAPIFSEIFYPYDQMPVSPNPLAGSVCCRCLQNELEDLLESCNVCQRLCVHRFCLDPPLFPWTCDSCKDLQTLHRRRFIC